MPFSALETDVISIHKHDGTVHRDIRASVQRDKIFISRSDLLIEPGDLVRRTMSNGGVETYSVIDPGFQEAFHSIPAGYQMEVRKLGIPEAKEALQNVTYNLSGHSIRLNQNSIDLSTNVIIVAPELAEQLSALRRELDSVALEAEQRTSAHDIVDALESHLQSPKPKRAVAKALLEGLPHVGSLASIGSFILDLLSG